MATALWGLWLTWMPIMIQRLVLILFFLWPSSAAAQSVQETIVAQLSAQGFKEITAERTWLGRIQLRAYSDTLYRELVFNPTTGEILRDYWRERDGDTATPRILNPSNNQSPSSSASSSSGSGRSVETTDDDDHDDDDDDDNDDDDGGDDD